MSELQLILSPVSLDRLKREQPNLHRELCDGVAKIYMAKRAIDRLPQPYVIDGALAEVLQLIEDAMTQLRSPYGMRP